MDGWLDGREKEGRQNIKQLNNSCIQPTTIGSAQRSTTQLNSIQLNTRNPNKPPSAMLHAYVWVEYGTYDFLYYYTLPFFLTSIIQVSFYLDTKRKSSISCRSEYKSYTSCAFIIYFCIFFLSFRDIVLCYPHRWSTFGWFGIHQSV